MPKMLKKIWAKKSNKYLILSISLVVLVSFFVGAHVQAGSGMGDMVAELLGWIIEGIIWAVGQLLTLVMWALITIAQYNDFINSQPVVLGWVLVRDVCNMFFILILLIIAFGTILRIPQYNFKTLLPKLIIMAILINFSKLICGFLIDFAQVIMLTFVNGFKDVGQGNLFNMLGIDQLMSIDPSSTQDVTSWSILGTLILALIFTIIALIVVVTMVAMLAMRIIMMWVYIVLSPMAYLLAAFPQGQSYSGQWWDRFSKNLIVGPVLAFFIWLAFASLGGTTEPQDVHAIMQNNNSANSSQLQNTSTNLGLSGAGSTSHMIKFIISIAMLLGGLQIAQEIGGEAGKIAGKGSSTISKLGATTARSLGTGLKRATGVERAQMAYKTYRDSMATERAVRARSDAGAINRGIGQAKQTLIAKPWAAMKRPFTAQARKAETARAQAELEKNDVLNPAQAEEKAAKEKMDELEGVLTVKIDAGNEMLNKKNDIEQKRTSIDAERERFRNTGVDTNGNVVRDSIAYESQLDKQETALDVEEKGLKAEAASQGWNDYDNLGKEIEDYKVNNPDVALYSELRNADNDVKEFEKTGKDKNGNVVPEGEKDAYYMNLKAKRSAAQTQAHGSEKVSEVLEAKEKYNEAHKKVASSQEKISGFEAKAKRHEDAQDKINALGTIGKYVTAAAALTLGAATGGIGLGVIAGAAAYKTPKLIDKQLSQAGNKNLNRASNYNVDKIDQAKKTMAYDKEPTLMKTMNDPSKSAHEQTAAFMLASENGYMVGKDDQVKRMQDTITKTYFKDDKKVENMVYGSVGKHHKQFAPPISDLTSPDPKVVTDAMKRVQANFAKGLMKLGEMDAGSIDLGISGINRGLAQKPFETQYDGLDGEMRGEVKKALTREMNTATNADDSYNAGKKLVYTNDNDISKFKDGEDGQKQKERFINESKREALNNIAVGRGEPAKAFFDLLKQKLSGLNLKPDMKNGDNYNALLNALKPIMGNAGLGSGSSQEKELLNKISFECLQGNNTAPAAPATPARPQAPTGFTR